MPPRVVLFPSPLLARAEFFEPLAAALRQSGHPVTILQVPGSSNAAMGAGAAQQAHRTAGDEPVVLVPYSGAGPLAPFALEGFPVGQAATLFLDATLPHPGRPRLAELREALPPEAFEAFERDLRAGGSWPNWREEQLAPLISDEETRRTLLGMATPRPLAFFEEPLPPSEFSADLPGAYLRLSAAYDQALEGAESHGWTCRSLDLTHFAPYTHPGEVAREIIALCEELHPGR